MDPIRIYGFHDCIYCQRSRALLDSEGVRYDLREIPTPEDRRAWMDSRGFGAGQRTFPRIYTVGASGEESLLGGYTDLEEALFTGPTPADWYPTPVGSCLVGQGCSV